MSQQSFIRAFPSSIERTGPRTLTGRLVPYNRPAEVIDELPDGQLDRYREGFRPGAFGIQANSTEKGVLGRIGFIHRHDGGLGYLGPFVALRDEPDGLYGDVRILPTKADDVAALIDEGVNELSVEFRLPKNDPTEITADGTRWRTRAHLDQVALEPRGAYSTAQVLAFRSEADDEQRAEAERQEAERKAAADAEAAEAAKAEEERQRIEAEAAAALARRDKWAELTARLDPELEKQKQLVSDYGVTRSQQ